jgi:hypothetical protein
MNTKIFTVSKEQLIKVGIKFLLVILAGIATFLESTIPGFLKETINEPLVLTIVLAANTALIDFIRKYITNEEGKINILGKSILINK